MLGAVPISALPSRPSATPTAALPSWVLAAISHRGGGGGGGGGRRGKEKSAVPKRTSLARHCLCKLGTSADEEPATGRAASASRHEC